MKIHIPDEVYDLLGCERMNEKNQHEWIGGVHHVTNISYKKLSEIAEILGKEFLDSSKNGSPTVQEFLEFFEEEAETTFFGGYLVTEQREDERLTIDVLGALLSQSTIAFCKEASEVQRGPKYIHAYWD